MDRRSFFGLGLAPLLLAGNALRSAGTGQTDVARGARRILPERPAGYAKRGEGEVLRRSAFTTRSCCSISSWSSAPTACARRPSANLRKVQDLLGERMGRDIFFYSITLQPKKDTPTILKEYSDNFDIKPGWTFLTGKPADVEKLRRALGYVDWDPRAGQGSLQPRRHGALRQRPARSLGRRVAAQFAGEHRQHVSSG